VLSRGYHAANHAAKFASRNEADDDTRVLVAVIAVAMVFIQRAAESVNASAQPRVPREISSPASCGKRRVIGIERNEKKPTTKKAGQKSDHRTIA
jgi:hypothetical protein